ncbi:MAG: sulfite exporter TauE/SafE family protein [Opitutae bacterium]|nr:sulfite exporter TauE/SafE family protein [Opitutae bacterium]
MHYDWWQWTLLALGAGIVGFSKTGIPGFGILFVAVFANVMPARQATGVVLPLLMFGDLFSVVLYRRHLEWRQVWRLFPWTFAGVVLGWLALGRINDAQTTRLVGGILAFMLGLHVWRRASSVEGGGQDALSLHATPVLAATCGVLAGFTTLVANAAGPVMVLYLLSMRLGKMEFLGTSAAFFLLLNWTKVPFVLQLGLINTDSLALNLWLAPAVIGGALLGRWVIGRIEQKHFENTALALTAAATVKLLVF